MSVIKDVKSNLKFLTALLPKLRTADETGPEVDTQDSVGVAILVHVGLSGDTLSGSVLIDFEVQHSDTSGSGYAACADADLSAAVTGANTGTIARVDAAAEDELSYKVNYLGNKRYLKVVHNITGTHTNGCPTSAVVILKPAHSPAA